MRSLVFFLCLWCGLIVAFNGLGQTCKGSLGDPIFTVTFGAGPNPGPALPATVTTYNYDPSGCANDGSYSILNSVSPSCHSTWYALPHDHTGDPNGYMMLVNASYDRGVFYTQTAPALCSNTTYEFSAYIINLITPAAFAANPILPNITFAAITASGDTVGKANTGDIPVTADINGWVKYAVTFQTPANGETVVVKMINNAPGGNGNDLVIDDIAFRACGPIIQAGFGASFATADQTVCQGNSAFFNVSASLGTGFQNYVYQWQQNVNNGNWADIPGATNSSYTISIPNNAAPATYQYRVAVAAAENISSLTCRTYSDSLAVRVVPLPVAAVTGNNTVCYNSTITLNASGGTHYQWTGPGNTTLSTTTSTLVINNATEGNSGTYSVTAFNDYNCQSASAVSTTVTVLPEIVITHTANTTICSGSATNLYATGGDSYRWSPAKGLSDSTVSNPVATPDTTTRYLVTVTKGNCTDTASVTITVINSPAANAGPDKVIFEGQSTKLNGSATGAPVTYYWTPSDFLSDPTLLTPVATPTDDITYTLHVTSQDGCGIAMDDVFVKVYKKITIPNTFSPNNDGINDTWNIDALVTYPQCDVQIFNRYGEVVFKSIGYGKSWNGTSNGKPLPEGVYYYVIDLKNGQPKFSGWVTIIR